MRCTNERTGERPCDGSPGVSFCVRLCVFLIRLGPPAVAGLGLLTAISHVTFRSAWVSHSAEVRSGLFFLEMGFGSFLAPTEEDPWNL